MKELNPDNSEVIQITKRGKMKMFTNYTIHEHQLREVKGDVPTTK